MEELLTANEFQNDDLASGSDEDKKLRPSNPLDLKRGKMPKKIYQAFLDLDITATVVRY